MTIHTLGCSFTNWIYPTWADYIGFHYDTNVINLASPCQGNDTIKKHLYTIDKSDHVIIMFSGYDRLTVGVDQEYLTKKAKEKKLSHSDIQNLKNGRCTFFQTAKPFSAFLRSENKDEPDMYSRFHMMYDMLENIFECQTYLQLKGFDHTFCMWQGMYNDLTHLRAIGQQKISTENYEGYKTNEIFKRMYDSIDWSKFLQPKDKGIWEHILTDKKLVITQSTVDLHPSSYCNFDYFVKYIKPILDVKLDFFDNLDELGAKALRFSEYYAGLDESQIETVFPQKSGLYKKDDRDKARQYFFKIWDTTK